MLVSTAFRIPLLKFSSACLTETHWDHAFVPQELPVPSRPPRRPDPPGRFGVLTGGDRLVRQLQASLALWR